MATPFSRTIRSLQNDEGKGTQILLLVAIFFAILWAAWFLTAKVPYYESSRVFRVVGYGREIHRTVWNGNSGKVQKFQGKTVVARFPESVLPRIRSGQNALIRLEGDPAQTIHAKVIRVYSGSTGKRGNVRLLAEIPPSGQDPFRKNRKGEVKVEVGQVAPAVMIARTSGILTDSPRLTTGSSN